VVLADSVITALSNFAKLPLPNLAPIPVEPLIRETLEINPLPSNVQVSLDCEATLPPLLADRDQVRIVLGNLIRNAREAMPQGGQLALRACSAGPASGMGDGIEVSVT